MSEVARTDYPRPSLTADVVVVVPGDPGQYRVLFIRRARPPFQGAWALPGGFVEPGETVAGAAARELAEETSLTGVHVEELGCYSKPGRDPRGWVVSIAHLAIVPAARMADARAGDDAAAAAWLDLRLDDAGGFVLSHEGARIDAAAGGLAFDHGDILAAAVARLRGR